MHPCRFALPSSHCTFLGPVRMLTDVLVAFIGVAQWSCTFSIQVEHGCEWPQLVRCAWRSRTVLTSWQCWNIPPFPTLFVYVDRNTYDGWSSWWTVYCRLLVMGRPAGPDSLSQTSRMWAKLFCPKVHMPLSSLSWDICDHFSFGRDSGWKAWSPGPQNRDVYIYDGGHGEESVHRLRRKCIRAECIHILYTHVNLVARNHLTDFNTKLLVECQQEYLESTQCLIYS